MSGESFSSFGEIVSEVLNNRNVDPVLHMLVLTYEFDEQQLVNLVCGRNLEEDFELRQAHLKILSSLRPLVIYDARKTKEFSKIPQFLELHPFKTRGFSCHHSKAYVFITEKSVRLVIGSFNLTMSGLFRNREVFEAFHWNSRDTANLQILREWTEFLEGQYQERLKISSRSALLAITATLKARCDAWMTTAPDSDTTHMLFSGYDSTTGINSLRIHWKRWFPNVDPESLIVVSPFFDELPQNASLAGDLYKMFPTIQKMTLITDQSAGNELSQAHFDSIPHRELLFIPTELNKQEHDRIDRLARQTGNSVKDQRLFRNLHAKVLMLQSGNSALLYIGSANFSRKAWLGNNQELGIVTVESNPERQRESLIRHLSVSPVNQYSQLPIFPPAKLKELDDEEYRQDTNYPGFIEMITLTPNQDQSKVQFVFEIGNRDASSEKGKITGYEVLWSGISLKIINNISQWIERQEFQNRLLGARNIAFHLLEDPTQVFWFPYQYAGDMIADRETFLHPSSWDWMAYYLNPDSGTQTDPGEFLPGEETDEDESISADLSVVNREENSVIAMQSYLTLFTRIEKDFLDRVKDLNSVASENSTRSIMQQVIEPLQGFCRLLEREASLNMTMINLKNVDSSFVFKLGELLLLVDALEKKAPKNLATAFKPLRSQIHCILSGWSGAEDMQDSYINFVTNLEKV